MLALEVTCRFGVQAGDDKENPKRLRETNAAVPRWWCQICFLFFTPDLWGKDSNWRISIFQKGWFHQLVTGCTVDYSLAALIFHITSCQNVNFHCHWRSHPWFLQCLLFNNPCAELTAPRDVQRYQVCYLLLYWLHMFLVHVVAFVVCICCFWICLIQIHEYLGDSWWRIKNCTFLVIYWNSLHFQDVHVLSSCPWSMVVFTQKQPVPWVLFISIMASQL